MSYIVALTGGIGSGKSIVANAFSRFGINVIDSDVISRQLVEPNTPALQTISTYFGNSILNQYGTLNRRALRERIFNNPTEKIWLNTLLHPLIHQETCFQILSSKSPYILWVVPLLLENQLYKKADRVLVLDVSPKTQIQRTMYRDNISRKETERILMNQATRAERLSIADDIINNDDPTTLDNIISEVSRLHVRYLFLSKQTVSNTKLQSYNFF